LGTESIYAIGDCATVQHSDPKLSDSSDPTTAQAAHQKARPACDSVDVYIYNVHHLKRCRCAKGKYVARRLNALARAEPWEPFHYYHRGMLAYVGGYRAIADIGYVKGSGFVSYLFWRTAYFTNLVSLSNKCVRQLLI
jgi:NADH dehydrogenase FAD-containing subunit